MSRWVNDTLEEVEERKQFRFLIIRNFNWVHHSKCLPFWFWYRWCECECEWGIWCGWVGCGELIVLIGVCCCCWFCDRCVWCCCCWCCCCCCCWFPVMLRFNGFWFRTHIVFSRCQTNTLWTMAQPQNRIPNPIKTLVIIAGVEWNCVNVYKMIPVSQKRKKTIILNLWRVKRSLVYSPVKNIGMEMKNPPTAHTRLTLDFCRYLLPL